MKVWKCKQVVDFDKSTTTVKEERNKTLQQQATDKYNRFQVVTKMWSVIVENYPLNTLLWHFTNFYLETFPDNKE